MGYKEVSIGDYFNHLDKHWCKMDTKTIKRLTKSFYKPWDQIIRIAKFGKQLDEEQEYLQSAGIEISDASKLQFYTGQMIDSKWFDKAIIIRWEKREPARKTWEKATFYFEKMTRREESYIRGSGGTAKKTRFESSLNAREEREPASEQRDDNVIGADDAMREYLDNITAAAAAKEE